MESNALWQKLSFLSILQSSDKPHVVRLVLLGKFCLPCSCLRWRSQYKFKAVTSALKKPVQLYLSISQTYLTTGPFPTLTFHNSPWGFLRWEGEEMRLRDWCFRPEVSGAKSNGVFSICLCFMDCTWWSGRKKFLSTFITDRPSPHRIARIGLFHTGFFSYFSEKNKRFNSCCLYFHSME